MAQDVNEHNLDGIIQDQESLAIKGKVMDRLKGKNVYDAISKVAMFLGTMITTATAGVVMGGLLKGGGMAALSMGAGGLLTAPVVGALALGLAIIGIAVATDYIGSYIGQGANFDIQEASARSTARGMRIEFEEMMASNTLPVVQGRTAQQNWAVRAEAEKLAQERQIMGKSC